MARAMAGGSATMPTVAPAPRSLKKRSRSYPASASIRRGRKRVRFSGECMSRSLWTATLPCGRPRTGGSCRCELSLNLSGAKDPDTFLTFIDILVTEITEVRPMHPACRKRVQQPDATGSRRTPGPRPHRRGGAGPRQWRGPARSRAAAFAPAHRGADADHRHSPGHLDRPHLPDRASRPAGRPRAIVARLDAAGRRRKLRASPCSRPWPRNGCGRCLGMVAAEGAAAGRQERPLPRRGGRRRARCGAAGGGALRLGQVQASEARPQPLPPAGGPS